MINTKMTVLQYANTIDDSVERYDYLENNLIITSVDAAISRLERSIVETAEPLSDLADGDIFKYKNILWVLIEKVSTSQNIVMSLDAVGPMSVFSQGDVNYQNSAIKQNINMVDGNTNCYVYSEIPTAAISTGGASIISNTSFTDNFSIFADSTDTSAFCIPDLKFYQKYKTLLDPLYSATVRTWTASPRSTDPKETQLVVRNSDNRFDFAKYNERCGVRLVTRFIDSINVRRINIPYPGWVIDTPSSSDLDALMNQTF